MKSGLLRAIAGAAVLAALGAPPAAAQSPAPAARAQTPAKPTPQQLDAMLAPIALYPDALVAQILAAATYPLEVVLARRWLADPHNAALKGDQLAAALAGQDWDPSVKSLVAFPRVLAMMDGELDWTERLGEAFLADEGAVMDSIQRLRRRAQAAGNLRASPQAAVATTPEAIVIEPPGAGTVYIPDCNPSVVYGGWTDSAFPPDYFPGYFGGAAVGGFGCGWIGAPIVAPLWGWPIWNWREHRLDIDQAQFAALDRHAPPPAGGAWRHEATHRHGVPYRDSALRATLGGTLSSEAKRNLRGYPPLPSPPAARFGSPPSIAPPAPRPPPDFESFGRGADARIQAERGAASRQSIPSFAPRLAPGGFAPHFGGFAPHAGGFGGARMR